MNKLLLRFVLFFIPPVLLAYPVDILISNSIKKQNNLNNGEIGIWNDIYDSQLNSECLIYGSSRAWIHFDPAIIEEKTGFSAYNLGLDGQIFILQKFRHDEALKYNSKPKIIIHSLDIFTLENPEGLFNASQLYPYFLWNRDMKNGVELYNEFTFFDLYIPLYRYIGDSKSFINCVSYYLKSSDEEPARIKGYKGNDMSWNNDLEKARTKKGKYQAYVDSTALELYCKWIEECKEKNISIVMVYSPEYVAGQQFIENREKVIDVYKEISNRYGILFLDYSNDSISYNRDYFYNSTHLNKTGSQIFTEKFVDDWSESPNSELKQKN